MKACTRKQKIIARSSAEAELYVAALGASEAKGVESMMRDLGVAVKPVSVIDARATAHTLHRHGIGKMKHIDVVHLWLQDEVKSNRLRVRRVKSEKKIADIGTKAPRNRIIRKHAISINYVDAQENLRSGDVMGLWVDESEQEDQSSSAQQKTSLESAGGHARQQQQQQRYRGQPNLAEGAQERRFEARRLAILLSVSV